MKIPDGKRMMDTPERGDILKRREAHEKRILGLWRAKNHEKKFRKMLKNACNMHWIPV